MSPIARYTLLRVLLFVVVAALLFASGARDFTLLVLAIVLSGLVSLVLLRRPRDRVVEDVAGRIENRGPRTGLMGRISRRIEEANRAEDEAVAAAEARDASDGDADSDSDEGRPPAPSA